ncbi:MAG TPA: response regulator transcription factor [Gemmatimonadales bacterium]|nr:response regulator transcription factor [Gemmatimonadales bacterium]
MSPQRRSPRRPKARRGPGRVLIVDDHPLMRRGLVQLVAQEPDVDACAEAADATAAWTEAERLRPDFMVVDLSLRESEGLELIKGIRARYPEVRVLVLSMHDEKLYAERALRAGAAGYVQKQESPETVLQAIREVRAGGVYLSPTMAARILHRLVGQTTVMERSPLDTLSDRELEVLDLLGEGLSTRAMATRLHLSEKTVQTHREHLRAKLHLESRAELLRYAVARRLATS